MIYTLFSSNHNSPLTWLAKYALLQLLDTSLDTMTAVSDLILLMGPTIKGVLINTMEYLFNLVDNRKTIKFGAAIIIVILQAATSSTFLMGRILRSRDGEERSNLWTDYEHLCEHGNDSIAHSCPRV